METTPALLFDRVKKKILSLHKQNLYLHEENKKLKQFRNEDEQVITGLEQRIKALSNGLETMKLARAYSGEDGVDKSAKSKINEMVREIDRCIALLND